MRQIVLTLAVLAVLAVPTSALAIVPSDPSQAVPSSADTQLAHARALLLHGRFADGASLLRDLVRRQPRLAAAWRGLGVAEELMHHRPEAIVAYRRYLALAPADAPDADMVRERIERLVRELGWDPSRAPSGAKRSEVSRRTGGSGGVSPPV